MNSHQIILTLTFWIGLLHTIVDKIVHPCRNTVHVVELVLVIQDKGEGTIARIRPRALLGLDRANGGINVQTLIISNLFIGLNESQCLK